MNEKSGKSFMLIHETEEIWQCQFPKWSQQRFVILTRGTTIWWFETLGFDLSSIDESVCTSRSARFWWWILVTPDSWWQYQETARIVPRGRWELMLFPSYSGTLWWYSNKSRIDEIHAYSMQLERIRLPQMKFVGCSVQFWRRRGLLQKAKDSIRRSGTDGRMTRSTGSLSLPTIGRMLGAPHSQRERHNNPLYFRSVNEDKQSPPLPQRP